MDRWRLQRQGRRWFLGIIIAHLPKILFGNIGCLEFVFRGSQVIRSKKIIAQNYQLLGDYFPWNPGGQSCNCTRYRGR